MDPAASSNHPMALARATISELPDVVVHPRYSKAELRPGIVHIGLGNFHRAHQAWYIHRLMQKGLAQDWAIIGAGIRQYDAQMREKLLRQDCLTTLIELDPSGVSAEVTGAMIDYLPIEAENGALIRQLSAAETRIVSLTITEGGYFLDANTGAFDRNHADIRHDGQHPEAPRTVFGALVAALKLRRERGEGPFTALSCDNLQGNGSILRRCVVELAQMSDPDLAEWIEQFCTFPNSMVDCIVPATSDRALAQCRELGILDLAPVTHENFRQWVIEDDFCTGRPPLERVGVTITNNVHAYETMKLRILNGGHQLLANAGEILNVPTISACMQDPQIAAFFHKLQSEEITPHVAAVPEMTPTQYLSQITRRFANTAIHDTTRRVAFDGSSRHPGFLLPTLRDALNTGSPIKGLALSQALWARMCAGIRENGSDILANDPIWDSLKTRALASRNNPEIWLGQTSLYGDLGQNKVFAKAFATWLQSIWKDGTRGALGMYCSM